MNTPSLSIIIITLNEEKRLPNLLEDLAKQTWQDFEIIHVDSASEDNTVACSIALSPGFECYRTIETSARGVSMGRNTGANSAARNQLLFLGTEAVSAKLAAALTRAGR